MIGPVYDARHTLAPILLKRPRKGAIQVENVTALTCGVVDSQTNHTWQTSFEENSMTEYVDPQPWKADVSRSSSAAVTHGSQAGRGRPSSPATPAAMDFHLSQRIIVLDRTRLQCCEVN